MAGNQNEQRGLDEGSRPKGNADVGVLQLLPISPPEPDFFFLYISVCFIQRSKLLKRVLRVFLLVYDWFFKVMANLRVYESVHFFHPREASDTVLATIPHSPHTHARFLVGGPSQSFDVDTSAAVPTLLTPPNACCATCCTPALPLPGATQI